MPPRRPGPLPPRRPRSPSPASPRRGDAAAARPHWPEPRAPTRAPAHGAARPQLGAPVPFLRLPLGLCRTWWFWLVAAGLSAHLRLQTSTQRGLPADMGAAATPAAAAAADDRSGALPSNPCHQSSGACTTTQWQRHSPPLPPGRTPPRPGPYPLPLSLGGRAALLDCLSEFIRQVPMSGPAPPAPPLPPLPPPHQNGLADHPGCTCAPARPAPWLPPCRTEKPTGRRLRGVFDLIRARQGSALARPPLPRRPDRGAGFALP
jgi:hypothetical protein